MGNVCSETPRHMLHKHITYLRGKGLNSHQILYNEDIRAIVSEFQLYDALPQDLRMPDKLNDIRLESTLRKRPLTLQELLSLHNYIN